VFERKPSLEMHLIATSSPVFLSATHIQRHESKRNPPSLDLLGR
jgi:hypothetical protein